ncbi:MAG: NAD(P)H-dependent oxidoreductase [Bdellovibrionales bacterium]|nr:NAD(P)H-dependent oxidoreductase [Bdellovibrionales bacterium]
MTKITVISASGLKNLELAKKFEEQLIALGAEVQLLNLMTLELPLYTSESDAKNDAKQLLGPWFDVLHSSNGFVFLAPEYNGGIPPILTNFIAWVSRSSKDWRECFNGKCGIIGTFSGSGSGYILTAMRLQLSYLGMNVLGRQFLTHAAKPLDEKSLLVVCQQLITHSHL